MLANITNDLTSNVPFQPTRPTKTNAQVDSFASSRSGTTPNATGQTVDGALARIAAQGQTQNLWRSVRDTRPREPYGRSGTQSFVLRQQYAPEVSVHGPYDAGASLQRGELPILAH